LATIILNGVPTDTNPLAATDENDKLTVRGGLNGYEANALAGSDLVEIDQKGERISNTTIKGGEGDDSIEVDTPSFDKAKNSATFSGGTGDDTIEIGLANGAVVFAGRVAGDEDDDSISVVRADGATVQAGAGNDDIELGFATPLNGPGSRGDTTVDHSSVNGGKGADDISVLAAARA